MVPDSAQLLDRHFVTELETLARRLQIHVRSGQVGDASARRKGSSFDFRDHRPYVPGDDPRRLDWLAFARTGEPVVKNYHSEEDTVVRILVDNSASLGFGSPSKFRVAQRLAAAVGYLALSAAQRVQLLTAAGTSSSTSDVPNVRFFDPHRGRASLPNLLKELNSVTTVGRADLSTALQRVTERLPRPGALVVLSDFFDDGPLLQALDRARSAGHELALVQILAREEESPTLSGDCALLDSETGAVVEVSVDAAAINAYVMRLIGLIESLRSWAKSRGALYIRTLTDDALEPAVRRFVERRID